MLTLKPPARSLKTHRAVAASGATGLARRAQADLRARICRQLASEIAQQSSNQSKGKA